MTAAVRGVSPATAGDSTAAAVAETRPTNSRVTVAFAGCHWITGTVVSPVEHVLETVEEFFGVAFEQLGRGGMTYQRSAVGPGGARVYWSDDRPEVCVSLPGSACEHLGMSQALTLAVVLELRFSRCDIAWDIHGIAPNQVREAFIEGNVVTRSHRDSWSWQESPTGQTFYVGSGTSERMVRFYDMRGPTRMEIQFRGKRAHAMLEYLFQFSEAEWSGAALAHLRDFLDFRDRTHSTRPSDCPLLSWWAEIVADVGRVALPMPRPAFSPERLVQWFRKAVAPSFAVLFDQIAACPGEFVGFLLSQGRPRVRSRHRALVAMAGSGGLQFAS